MTTDIDEKLTTLEQLTQLLDAGHLIVLQKTGSRYHMASSNEKAGDVGQDATGETIHDVVRGIVTLHDLPY